jgi:hypothetical protein
MTVPPRATTRFHGLMFNAQGTARTRLVGADVQAREGIRRVGRGDGPPDDWRQANTSCRQRHALHRHPWELGLHEVEILRVQAAVLEQAIPVLRIPLSDNGKRPEHRKDRSVFQLQT